MDHGQPTGRKDRQKVSTARSGTSMENAKGKCKGKCKGVGSEWHVNFSKSLWGKVLST